MDKFKERIKNSKKAIEPSQKNNPNQLYQLNKFKMANKKPKFNLSLGLNFVLVTTLVIVLTIGGIGLFNNKVEPNGKENQNNQNVINPNTPTTNTGDFIKVNSLQELKTLLSDGNLEFNDSFDEDLDSPEVEVPTSPGEPSYGIVGGVSPDINVIIPSIKEEVYETNTQVNGVDEADIVKVNGKFIYYISRKTKMLHILKTNEEQVTEIKNYSFSKEEVVISENEEAIAYRVTETTLNDMYYTDLYLIVSADAETYTKVTTKSQNGTYTSEYQNISEYHIYDINTYELVKKIQTAGNNVSTRLVGNELIIVNNYNDYKKNMNLMLPRYFVDDVMIEPLVSTIYYCPYFGSNINSYVIIYKVILNNKIEIKDYYFLTPYIKNLYATKDKLYLIRYSGSISETKDNLLTSYNTSKVLVFDYEDEIKPVDVVTVKGRINDKYWIDEYEGFLRIASTGSKNEQKLLAGKYPYSSTSSIFNYLTIFKLDSDGKYQEISSITEGLGEIGETMYSARFNENRATVVTFKQTDPLYYIDLTDHYHPVITSELKISGFTVYQHPYNENYVIGFGYEANSQGVTKGYKIALFDVSDKYNIKQVGKPHVFIYGSIDAASLINVNAHTADYYYGFEVISNPKVLLSNMSKGIFGFSINSRDYVGSGSSSKYRHTNRYIVMKIDVNSDDPLKIILDEKHEATSYHDYYERMVFVGNYYYLLSSEAVKVYQLNNKLDLVGNLSF